MGCLRPNTPGFICTLVATVLLALVSFSVIHFESIYFLKAHITEDRYNGTFTFGALGYCLELSNGTFCSRPSIGYEPDTNSLIGQNTSLNGISRVAVKGTTLSTTFGAAQHLVALDLAGASTVSKLLPNSCERSKNCCSTFVSVFATTISLQAFFFDLFNLFIAKARLASVGNMSVGNAVWLTLAAWALLVFGGCNPGRSPQDREWLNGVVERNPASTGVSIGYAGHAEEMGLDAVKAEVDARKLTSQNWWKELLLAMRLVLGIAVTQRKDAVQAEADGKLSQDERTFAETRPLIVHVDEGDLPINHYQDSIVHFYY
ncbi:hypothetical protein F5880DRAFT_449346 [Lentinula raphanica]|nr:hypothetical protein F5880DRAFT_449346 [Lentinula raphanica]